MPRKAGNTPGNEEKPDERDTEQKSEDNDSGVYEDEDEEEMPNWDEDMYDDTLPAQQPAEQPAEQQQDQSEAGADGHGHGYSRYADDRELEETPPPVSEGSSPGRQLQGRDTMCDSCRYFPCARRIADGYQTGHEVIIPEGGKCECCDWDPAVPME